MLTQIAMAENLADKVDECVLNWGHEYCLHTVETAKLFIIQSSGVSVIQGLLKY